MARRIFHEIVKGRISSKFHSPEVSSAAGLMVPEGSIPPPKPPLTGGGGCGIEYMAEESGKALGRSVSTCALRGLWSASSNQSLDGRGEDHDVSDMRLAGAVEVCGRKF